MAQKREVWGTKIGLVLAMAGNAIGLGNFLRFPVQAAQNGGGAFMIPYIISFILLGIPVMWIEWTIGRHGGKYNHGSLPGMFDVMWKNKLAKYFGMLGLFTSSIILIYYTYLESWSLGFSFLTLFKDYYGLQDLSHMSHYLQSYQGMNNQYFGSIWYAYGFLLVTFFLNFYFLRKGISKGIEKLALFGVPLLLLFGIILVIRVITLGTPDPINHPEQTVMNGFAYLWNPDFSKLGSARVWLAAAGQIFFTLSIGMGTLSAYASYLKEKDDIALGGLATGSLNEFTEVILGGSIAIPIAVAFFGVGTTQEIANGGAFNLGFVSMPIIFQQLPIGNFIGFLWFFLLFIAGITSSVAMALPVISFLQEQFDLTREKATTVVGIIAFIAINFVVFFFKYGFLDELDYWSGTFALVIVALLEVIIFAWIFGIKKGWQELHNGAKINIPKSYYYIIKYITPMFLIILLVVWTIQDAFPTLLMEGKEAENIPYLWGARIFMVLIAIALTIMIRKAWKRNYLRKNEVK
ncbi:MAG: sodium:calcium symporter [Ignavibacteria bacterium GWF2_33_9]|nr:MAG: sodium:calcium symporter [Ignavibacteria bacterium GWF2_33_9]